MDQPIGLENQQLPRAGFARRPRDGIDSRLAAPLSKARATDAAAAGLLSAI
jgi:hypothetical protein